MVWGARVRAVAVFATFMILGLSLVSAPAVAGPAFFVDASGAYGQMQSPGAFYGTSNSNANAYGLGMGLWTTFTNGEPPLEFQLGVQDRYEAASDAGNSLVLNSDFGVLRLQASRIYLSFGYSPYVMKSGGPSGSSSSLSKVTGASALLGEMGMLMPITPKFSFGLSGVYETIREGGTASPSPVITGNFFMRFYFGFFGDGSSRSSNEFKGWRYPFGRERY